MLPRIATTGAISRKLSRMSLAPTSPAWTIKSHSRKAAIASARSRPCVSEMRPMISKMSPTQQRKLSLRSPCAYDPNDLPRRRRTPCLLLRVDLLPIQQNIQRSRRPGPQPNGQPEFPFDIVLKAHGLSFDIGSNKAALNLDSHGGAAAPLSSLADFRPKPPNPPGSPLLQRIKPATPRSPARGALR